MSRRTRLIAIVVAAALAAAGAAIGLALLLGDDKENGGAREGNPPLMLDLGVRTDAEAAALRGAESLYRGEKPGEAARVFARYGSPQAQIGAAFAVWPKGSLARLEQLGAERPRDALVLLHLGLARFWSGRDEEAVAAWREAARVQPDSPSAARAEDFLFPDFPVGRPFFMPTFRSPTQLVGLTPPRQLAFLARRARGKDVRGKLLYGLALQRLGHRVSAQAQYDAAAALEPGNAEAQVASAIGRFDKQRPAVAFSRLGPLTRRFPRAQTVRFHLGLLLLWLARVQSGAVEEGTKQLTQARALGPQTPLGRQAQRLLTELEGTESR